MHASGGCLREFEFTVSTVVVGYYAMSDESELYLQKKVYRADCYHLQTHAAISFMWTQMVRSIHLVAPFLKKSNPRYSVCMSHSVFYFRVTLTLG